MASFGSVLAKFRPSKNILRSADKFEPATDSPAVLQPVSTIAIWGPAGAPGKSTLAANLADALAVSGLRTLLIDTDLVAPSLALQLGFSDQAAGISSACKLAREARLTADELERVAVRVDAAGASVWVLPGISGASRWPEITPSAIEAILRVASLRFDVAVFDLASSLEPALRTEASAIGRNELTRHLISSCDHLVAISHSDALGVQRMLRQLLDVQKLRSGAALTLVINRVRETVLGANPERQLAQTFQSLLKIPPTHFLPDDPTNTDGALRGGIPVRLFRRHSPYAKAIKALAQQLRV